jgi:sporulation protein YlmC with PRC-barrel domain
MRVNIQTLFNLGLRAKNEDHVGRVMEETSEKIVIFGESNKRYDIPKSRIYQVGMYVVLKIEFPEILESEVSKDSPLHTGQSIESIKYEAYPDDYHGAREE